MRTLVASLVLVSGSAVAAEPPDGSPPTLKRAELAAALEQVESKLDSLHAKRRKLRRDLPSRIFSNIEFDQLRSMDARVKELRKSAPDSPEIDELVARAKVLMKRYREKQELRRPYHDIGREIAKLYQERLVLRVTLGLESPPQKKPIRVGGRF